MAKILVMAQLKYTCTLLTCEDRNYDHQIMTPHLLFEWASR